MGLKVCGWVNWGGADNYVLKGVITILNTSGTMILQSSLIYSVPAYNSFCYCSGKFTCGCFCKQVEDEVKTALGWGYG